MQTHVPINFNRRRSNPGINESMLQSTMKAILLLISLITTTWSSSLTPSRSELRPRVEFVPDFMLEANETAEQNVESLQCDNNDLPEIFDGDEYLIRSRNFPNRPTSANTCTYRFVVKPSVAVSLMCSSFNVPCVWRNFLILRSSSRRRAYCSRGRPSRTVTNIEIPIRVDENEANLSVTHIMRRANRRGRGFSCIVRGLGGTRRPEDDDENDNNDDNDGNFDDGDNDNEDNGDNDNEDNDSTTASPQICGVSTAPMIIGGSETAPNAYPWMAALQLGGSFCGGSLINNQWILTAAHCSVNKRASRIFARLGCHDRFCGSRLSISANIIPDTYRFPRDDIALLKLREPLRSFSAIISPVCLPNVPVQAGSTLTVTGWGLTSQGALASSLKSATLRAKADSTCLWSIPRDILCTQPLNGNTCNGDSGSAVVQRSDSGLFVQHGVVSFGAVGCPSGIDSGHTEVVYYIDDFVRPNAGQVFLRGE